MRTGACPFVRVVVCLNLAGVLATQSRGALVAVLCGAFLVPAHRYREFAVPLVAGLALGVAAIGSSPGRNPVLWLAPVLVMAVVVAALSGRQLPRARAWSTPFVRTVLGVAVLCAAIGAAVLVHHEVGLRVLAPSDQDRSAEWSSALINGSLARSPESDLTVYLSFILRPVRGPVSPMTNTSRSAPTPALSASALWRW